MPSRSLFSRRETLAGVAGAVAALAGCGDLGQSGPGTPERRVGPLSDPEPGTWPREDYSVRRNRHNPHATPPRTAPEARWEVDTAGVPTLVVVDDTVYVGDDTRIRALDATDGSERWERTHGAEALVHRAGRLYAMQDGTLRALRAADGSEQWSTSVDGQVLLDAVEDYGVVLVPAYMTGVHGLHADTGERLWTVENEHALPLAGLGGAYLQPTRTRLESLSPAQSADRFSANAPDVDPWTGYSWRRPSTPVVTDQRVYLGGRPEYGADESAGYLNCFDRRLRSVEWRRRPPSEHTHSPAVAEGMAFTTGYPPSASTSGGRIYAFDAANGDLRWTREPGHFLGPAVVANGTVYAGGSGPSAAGRLYAVDAASGELLWSRRTPGATTTEVAAVGETLYVGDSGTVLALASP